MVEKPSYPLYPRLLSAGGAFFYVLVLLLSLLTSCSSSANNLTLAEQAVVRFHSLLDSEQYQAIYLASDSGFRKNSTEDGFVKFAQTVHHKLGHTQNAKLRTSQIGWVAGEGAVVTLFYDTQFEDGTAAEKFTWHFKRDQPILYGYYIKSNSLVER
jgi:Protein of unknown function (DUF4019)